MDGNFYDPGHLEDVESDGAMPRVQLRISGRNGVRRALGPNWTEMRHVINVEFVPQEVELVCELSDGPAKALFDAESLRLVRRR